MADLLREDRADERLSILPLKVHRVLLLIIGVILTVMDLSRLSGAWPCDIACQGGAYYQTLFGISVIWPALMTHALLTWLAWYDVRRGRSNLWTVRLVYFLFGVAVFFILIARELDLSCTYCQLVQWLTLLALFLVTPFTTRRVSVWLPIAGWLIMNALYHHRAVPDAVTAIKPTTGATTFTNPESTRQIYRLADQGRTFGASTAPHTLDVVIDLTCGHCAEQYRPLMEALKPAITAKRVQVIVRHLVRPSQPASLHASELVFAASAIGEHATAMDVLLGSNPDAGFAGLKARLAEVVDATKLDRVLATDAAQLTALIADDQNYIGQLGMGPRSPSAVLREGGKVVKRWSGTLPAADIVAALDGTL